MMRHDDEMLMRYADGELGAIEAARVARAAAGDPAVAARLDEHRGLRTRLAAHYGPVVDEEVPARLTALVTAGGVVDIGSARPPSPSPSPRSRWQPVAIAASLAAGVLAGQLVPRGAAGPVAFEDGAMIARGQVARALDTQLASTQGPQAAVRIGVSFPGEGGRACRTFEAPALAGVACRSEDRWQVLVTAPGVAARRGAGYAQAGRAGAVVMEAAQDMMRGEPLDAAAERRARDGGWTSGIDGKGGVGGDARRP